MFNFAEATRLALEAGAAIQASDTAGAVREALRLLSNAGERDKMGAAGKKLCDAHRGATQKHLLLCEELLGTAITDPATGPTPG
jgi:3-deoxy-D-manno-octulosonic-acid transferase